MALAANKHCIFNPSHVDTVWPQVLSSGGRLSSIVSGLDEINPRLYLGEIQLSRTVIKGRGFSPSTTDMTPAYFCRKIEEK